MWQLTIERAKMQSFKCYHDFILCEIKFILNLKLKMLFNLSEVRKNLFSFLLVGLLCADVTLMREYFTSIQSAVFPLTCDG